MAFSAYKDANQRKYMDQLGQDYGFDDPGKIAELTGTRIGVAFRHA